MKKLNFIRLFISLVVFIFYNSEISFAQLTPPEQVYVLSFTNDKIAIAPVNALLNPGSDFTMEAWIFPKDNQDAIIMGKHLDAGHAEAVSYIIQIVEGGKLEFIQTIGDAGSWTSVMSTNVLVTNSWTHVAATLGDGNMKLFINGVEEGNIASPGTLLNESIPFVIGNCYDANQETGAGFFGHIAQLCVWDKALTTTEIVDYASIYLNGDETGLVAYWPLDDGEGQIARDISPNELHIQLGTTPEEDINDPKWINSAFVNETYFTLSQHESFKIGQGVFIDFDYDSDMDFVGTKSGTILVAMENDGTGFFSDATVKVLGTDTIVLIRPGSELLVEDFNGDGRQDLFIADMGLDDYPWGGAPNYMFIQTMDGRLVDESEARLPEIIAWSYSEDAGDIDNDGDIDIYCNQHFLTTDQDEGYAGIYINDGNGYFTYDTTRLPRIVTITRNGFGTPTFFDIDQDNDLDIFSGSAPSEFSGVELTNISHNRDVILFNDGNGYFSYLDSMIFPIHDPPYFESEGQPNVPIEDINNDGWDDIVQVRSRQAEWVEGGSPRLKIYLNNRNGTFRHADYMLSEYEYFDMPYIDDFNNDGRGDFIASAKKNGFKLFLNRANVEFIDASPLIPLNLDWYQMAYPTDLDNDSDIDILITTGEEFYVIKNEKPFDVLEHFPIPVPPIPELISPDNETSVSENQVLKWNASLKTSCHIQVSKDPEFLNNIIDTAEIVLDTLLLQNLTVNQSYYWRVNASNITGTSAWSEVRVFTVTETPVLQTPEAGEIVSLTPTLSWNKIDGAISYNLQISTFYDFQDTLLNLSGIDTNSCLVQNLYYCQQYYWRVNVITSFGTSSWSETGSFITLFPNPPQQDYVLEFMESNIAIAPTENELNLGEEFTMETWIFLKETSFQDGLIMGKVFNGLMGDPEFNYAMRFGSNGRNIEFIQSTGLPGTNQLLISNASIELNEWMHIAIMLDDGIMKIFINGKEDNSRNSPGIPTPNTDPFTLGAGASRDKTICSNTVKALYAQVRVWNTALTPRELIGNASKYIDGNEENLIAYWPLDDGGGQIARDVTANGLDLMLGTTTEDDENDPLWTCNIPQQAEIPIGDTMLCQNSGDINYTTSGATYSTSYEWFLAPKEAGTITGTDTIGTVDWSDTFNGAVEISVKGINDCAQGELSEILTVYLNPLPIADFTFETNELEVTFTNTSTNASSYLWNFGDGNTETAEDPVYIYASSGDYSAVLTSYSIYCGEATDTQSVSITTGVNSIEFENIAKIYPNPSKGIICFEVIDHLTNDLIIQIINVKGQVIYSKNKNIKTIEKIDLSNYAKGVYFIQVKSEKYSKTGKLIIE